MKISLRFVLCVFLVLFFGAGDRRSQIMEKRKRGPDAATRWRIRAMLDEYGRLNPDGRIEALRDFEANLNYQHDRISPAAAADITWTPRGPNNRGGRARALVVHPQQSRILWAAASSGGLWKSDDAGASWRPLADTLGLSAGCLVMDPRNPDVLYFGTGERFHSGGPGAGVFVTRDGGESWLRLASTRRWRYVPSIAISPANSDLLLAAVADPDFPKRSGVFRSTNAGKTWTRTLTGDRLTPSALAFQPGSGSRVLLSVREGLFPSGEARVMFSEDAGLTWIRASGIGTTQFTRYEISYAPSQPQIVYAISREGTFRSEDGGASFVQRSAGLIVGLASWTGALWVSPTDPDLLLAGGVSLSRSRNGGVSWDFVNYFNIRIRDVGHHDFQAIVPDPDFNGKGNRRVYLMNDGGIDRLNDVLDEKSGVSLDRGLQTTEFYAVAGNAGSRVIMGGAQDRGVLRGRLGATRTTLDVGGDGVCTIIDPKDTRYQYGCSQLLYIVRIQPNPGIVVSSDLPDSNSGVIIRANFKAPVLLDPNKTSRMLGAGASLWRSENVRNATNNPGERAVWEEIKPELPRAFPQDEGILISAVAVATGDSDEIWVAHNDGRLFRTQNGLDSSPNWTAVDDNAGRNPLPNRWPASIVIDASNKRRIFVAFGGFTPSNLWRSDNGGSTWRSASGSARSGLPKAPIWSLAQHPEKPNTFVAGTEVGVYITNDGGGTWNAIRAPFTAAAQDLNFLQGSTTLLVGTFGRGLWTVELDDK